MSKPEDKSDSPLIDTPKEQSPIYTYILTTIVIALVVYIFYYSYTCFQTNQDIGENFIEQTIKTGTDSDKSFDMDKEIKRLSDIQEQYLRKLNRR